MQEKYYEISFPKNVIAIMKFNECQQNILDLEKHVKVLLTNKQREKLKQAYNLLNEVQYWFVDNVILFSESLKQEDISILGEVILFKD